MNDRPKRERKPTTFFQYSDTSAESTIANVGGTPSKRRSTIETRGKCKIKKEDVESPDKSASVGRGRGRGRGRNRGRGARGRAGLRSGSIGRSVRHKLTDANDQQEDTISALFSDSIEDAGALLNDNDDPEFEEDGNEASTSSAVRIQRNLKVPSGRKVPAIAKVVSRLPTDGDEVIEQWYADPYERVNPNDFAYDQWRLRNLQFSLQNQGYSIVNSKQMAAWLMKCNGHFMEFDAPARKSRAKKPKQTATENDDSALHSTAVSDVDGQQDDEEETHGTGDYAVENSEQALRKSEAAATFAAFKSAISPRRVDPESAIKESQGSIQDRTENVTSNLSFTATLIKTVSDANGTSHGNAGEKQDQDEDLVDTHSNKTTKLSDKRELENLKRCLNVFNAVYGPQGPRSNPAKFELNHFSQTSALPVLKPKAGLRTQAHYALHEVLLPADNPAFLNGIKDLGVHDQEQSIDPDDPTKKFRKVLTEDPDFGLTAVPKSQRATEADMKLYYAQFARAKTVGQGTLKNTSNTDPDEQENIEDLTKEERRVLIKAQNVESASVISSELNQKLFEWETPSTMRGEAPKQSKDDKMRPGAFALSERHVWKEVRRRQEILDEGGEEAARLLEQEWEDAQLESKREERRRQNANTKARKMAAWEGFGSGGVGEGSPRARKRKRVKFSGWVAEE